MLCRQQEFLSLPADKLVEIIRDDDLNVAGEETVYEACMEWLNFDLTLRFKCVSEVMKCVRFANISSYYFCDKIDHNEVHTAFNASTGKIDYNAVQSTNMIKSTVLR